MPDREKSKTRGLKSPEVGLMSIGVVQMPSVVVLHVVGLQPKGKGKGKGKLRKKVTSCLE